MNICTCLLDSRLCLIFPLVKSGLENLTCLLEKVEDVSRKGILPYIHNYTLFSSKVIQHMIAVVVVT
jgi:hypothetical protein